MKLSSKIVFGVFLTLLFTQCKKTAKPNSGGEIQSSPSDVLILNEGNFMWGNADFDIYNQTDSNLNSGAFKQINNSSLGDVLQSACQIGNKIYLIVNNSAKIVIIDSKTYKYINTISGFNSPRYIQSFNDSQAIVTDLYANKLHIVNLNTNKITGNIPVSGACEELVTHGNTTYICNNAGGQIYLFDHKKITLTDSIKIDAGAQWIRKDKYNNLWVLCSKTGNSSLISLDVNTKKQIRKIVLTGGSMRLCTNSTQDTVFLINSNVKFVDLNNTNSQPQLFFEKTGANFYGLNYDERFHKLYVSDAKDYVSRSMVYVVGSDGKLKTGFQSGIITCDFLFVKR